jgi:quinol monooxygenase YgiN
MPIFKIARFEVRADAHDEVERAMREFAAHVGAELPDSSWVTYRDARHPNRYVSLISADNADADARHRSSPGTRRFVDALYPHVVGEVEFIDYDCVADSVRSSEQSRG